MSKKYDIMERRHVLSNCAEEVSLVLKRDDNILRKSHEYEKKIKREIANNNERRRMKSINMGFEMLKQLLPSSIDGEKLSKASILQLTAQYIENLHSRITKLETDLSNFKNGVKPENNCDKEFDGLEKCVQENSSKTNELVNGEIMVQQSNTIGDSNSCRKRRIVCTTDTATSDIATCNKSLEDDDAKLLYCEELSDETSETPGSLEHLVAAIQQVEGEQFCRDRQLKCQIISSNTASPGILLAKTTTTSTSSCDNSPSVKPVTYLLKPSTSPVIKPTISPYTDQILCDLSRNPHLFKAKFLHSPDSCSVRKISIPPKYHHRPDVVLQKSSVNS